MQAHKQNKPKEEVYTVYHGTNCPIKQFNSSFLGKGDDQYESGFYFTDKRNIAHLYCSGDTPTVVKAEVRLNNPIVIDGTVHSNLSKILINANSANLILAHHSNLYRQSDDDVSNPLDDYLAYFWDNSFYSESEFREMIEDMANSYFRETNLQILDCFFATHTIELPQGIKEVLGNDGVIVNFKDHRYVIAWFPEQIFVKENQAETNYDNLF